MRRRALLSTVAGGIGAGVLAGCLGSQDRDRSSFDPAADSPVETLSVGSRESVAFPANNQPHRIHVRNVAPDPQTFELSVDGLSIDEHATTVSVQPDEYASIVLNGPSEYMVRIGRPGTPELQTFFFEPDHFDCNEQAAIVSVPADDAIEVRGVGPATVCPSPTPADHSIAVTGTSCRREGASSARVAFGPDGIGITGDFFWKARCDTLSLDSVVYREEPDSLDVVVAPAGDGSCSSPDGDATCPDSDPIAVTAYEATVAFEHDLPSVVRVFHLVAGGSQHLAAEVTRDMSN
ncbi:hypothetical protein [Haloarchaeobius sp. HME9146]|uniref:hypothetical protein n=1 Tax=Haloarchaeobius sp. HME9146 TaxID=2978732 RepID=UPI0021BFE326|nr:hypothetical protein [Haloarchaeobius sp. HME9146]MCT9095998.1 hypothetical protein [Haloarchaeobius sp. HME9146]